MILGVLGGISLHGGLRVWSARKQAKHEPELEKIYMLNLSTSATGTGCKPSRLILAFTGFVIHKPEMFGALQFKGVVLVHNIMAAILEPMPP